MSGTIRYTIRPYDTIWMLAQVFNTTVDSIMELNPGIEPRNLLVGQVITIAPGYQYYASYPNMQNGNMQNGNMRNGNMQNGNMQNGNMNGHMNGNMQNGNMNNGNMGLDMGMSLREADLTSLMHMLWQQHVKWARFVIDAMINNSPALEAYRDRFLRNPYDFSNALRAFYGEEVAMTFEEAFTAHEEIGMEYVQNVINGDTNAATDAEERWYDNASQISDFLSSVNPYWAEEDWDAMLNEHLDLLKADVENMLAGNYSEAVNMADTTELQALEMADIMAQGIVDQFPG